MVATWSNNQNVAESSAGIDDSWTFWHGLWPPLSLKGLSGNRWFPTSPFTTVVKYNSLYTHTPDTERHFTCLFALIITFSFSTLTWNSEGKKWHDRFLHNSGIIKTPPLFSDDTYWGSFDQQYVLPSCWEYAIFLINRSYSLFVHQPVNIFTQKSWFLYYLIAVY